MSRDVTRDAGSTAAAGTPYLSTMGFVRAVIAVLVSLATLAGVIAVERGVAWGISGWSLRTNSILLALGLTAALAAIAWTYLLRPRLQRRKEREDARLRERAIRDRAGDRIGAGAGRIALDKPIEDAGTAAGRARQG